MNHLGLFIDNERHPGHGDVMRSADPATGEIIREGASADAEDVDRAVKSAEGAFADWAVRDITERIQFLDAFGGTLRRHRDELGLVISRETGKPLWESDAEVGAMIAKIEISVEANNDRCGQITRDFSDASGITRFRPHGVVAVFGPFNLPGHLPDGHIVPALLAGNTVVFKPGEQAPLVADRTVELWVEAGLPPGVINMVHGAKETGEAPARHPGLRGLFFTRGEKTGKALHRLMGGRPEVILALEMGGNNPLVVHEVSDIPAAAHLMIQSSFITAGQRCTCARRLILVDGAESERLLDELISTTQRLKIGPYWDRPEPFMGPVISPDAADSIEAARADLIRRGATDLLEMKRLGPALLSPGILEVGGVTERPDEEIFGPLLQVICVSSFEAALREAGATRFGLAAGLISDNRRLYDDFHHSVRAGVINWNRPLTGASGRMPFGGVGASGNHRPSGYFAADYCSYPVASIESHTIETPRNLPPGVAV